MGNLRRIPLVGIAVAVLVLLPIVAMAQDEAGNGEAGEAAEAETTAEEESEESTSGAEFGVGLETVQRKGETWTRLHFFPVMPVGKFRFAVDLELFFNQEGEISSKGWDFSSRDATLDSLSRKIYFIA